MKAVLLDAGLTLLRARPSLGAVYTLVARRHGRDASPESFERAAAAAFHAIAEEHRHAGLEGLRTSESLERESWRRHARKVMEGLPDLDGMDFDAWFEDLYDAFGGSAVWVPFDDAVPALEALRERGLALAVVSNWDCRLHRILGDNGLTPYFDAVVVSSEVGWRKPHPAIFERAFAALSVRPSEALHVGDSKGDDIDGAAAAGVRAVLIDREGRGPAGVPAVRDLREIVALLEAGDGRN